MRERLREERGLSLVEVAVVALVTLLVLLAAQQMLVGLLRERKRLASEALTTSTLPFLLDRIHKDLTGAARAEAGVESFDPPSLRLELTPGSWSGPRIVYAVTGRQVSRTEVPEKGSGEKPVTRRWRVKGSLDPLPDELAFGRLAFLYRSEGSSAEYVAFALPRGAAGEAP